MKDNNNSLKTKGNPTRYSEIEMSNFITDILQIKLSKEQILLIKLFEENKYKNQKIENVAVPTFLARQKSSIS